MTNPSDLLPPLDPPPTSKRSAGDADIGLESTFDLQFPLLVHDDYRLDISRGLKITQRLQHMSVVEAPRFEDRTLFSDIPSAKPKDLLLRGSLLSPTMEPAERETFVTVHDVIQSGDIQTDDPRESTTEPTRLDISDIPEASITEEPLVDEPVPSTSFAMDIDPPPLDMSERALTNRDVQKSIYEQEKLYFPDQYVYRPPSQAPPDTPHGSVSQPQDNPQPPVELGMAEQVMDIKQNLISALNLIKAQSGLFTLMKEMHTDIKTLTAEVMSLRSETTHLNKDTEGRRILARLCHGHRTAGPSCLPHSTRRAHRERSRESFRIRGTRPRHKNSTASRGRKDGKRGPPTSTRTAGCIGSRQTIQK
jgi:hypothetical protein